jgi:N6-adenosine-specific RNA methylase IME4
VKGSFLPEQAGKEPLGSVVVADIQEHSRKPDIFYDIIESMYPQQRYLELFARKTRSGWSSWGDELVVTQ